MPRKQKFTDDELENMLASGMKQKDIAKKFGVTANGISARVAKMKKKAPEKSKEPEIDQIKQGQLVEYHGEKCVVIVASAGRIIMNTSTGQKIIKKDDYDCVCGILIKKGTPPPEESKAETVKQESEEAIQEMISERKTAPDNCNGTYDQCIEADTDCEKCNASERPLIQNIVIERNHIISEEALLEDATTICSKEEANITDETPLPLVSDDIKIYEHKEASFDDIIDLIL